jgi:hypothetical protein
MNDIVRVMRWCGWLVVAACNRDPSLDISVHHPMGYAVEQTVVTVYFGGDVTCSEIELGDRTDAELAAITVDEVDVTDGGRVEVSRLGGKSIVARGYDAKHRFVTAGCKDVGEVAGDTRVAIDTQPTASIAIEPGQPDRPFAERTILVNMTDAGGKPIDGTVSWLLSGPAGSVEQTASGGMPTRNGNISVKVTDLGMPGPQGLRIRASWATAPLPLVTGFDLSHATTVQLGGGALGGHPSCEVRGHAGQAPTLICLAQANLQGHRDAVEIAWQGAQYAATPIAIPSGAGGIDNQFALFVDHDGSASEPVYVLCASTAGTGSWYKLGGPDKAVTFDGALQNVIYVPKCAGTSTSALVGVQTGTAPGVANKLRYYTPAGMALGAGAAEGEIFAGGCLDDVDARAHQAVVAAGMNGDAGLQLIGSGSITTTPVMTTRLTGAGFVTIETQGRIERRFAGTRLQATGTVVFEDVLAPDAGSFKLVERTEVEAAAPPVKIISGKLDRDGDSDLMWDMAVGARRRLFQVSLAKQVGGAPLTAMTSGPGAITTTATGASDFVAADLNGHGSDEMIVFTAAAVTIYSPDE